MGKKFIDLTEKRFGRLLILSQAEPRIVETRKKIKLLKRYWVCQCDCGNKKEIRSDGLGRLKNPITSCGCLQKEKAREIGKRGALPAGEKPFNDLFGRYKYCARTRKIEFYLSKEQFRQLTQGNCHYCQKPPSQKITGRNKNFFIYNGIDRVDSSKPYSIDNVVSCCGDCNYCKSDFTKEKFLDLVRKIYHTHFNETCINRENQISNAS